MPVHLLNKPMTSLTTNIKNSTRPATEQNWLFIDAQNFYKGIKERGWQIDWMLFRQFLTKKYDIVKAIIFMGYIEKYRPLYHHLQQAGFEIEFREVRVLGDGTIDGGNVDADLASYVMDYKMEYDKAVIVADDSDYLRTLKSLVNQNKLKALISSHLLKHTSQLIKRAIAPEFITTIHSFRNQIENKIL